MLILSFDPSRFLFLRRVFLKKTLQNLQTFDFVLIIILYFLVLLIIAFTVFVVSYLVNGKCVSINLESSLSLHSLNMYYSLFCSCIFVSV